MRTLVTFKWTDNPISYPAVENLRGVAALSMSSLLTLNETSIKPSESCWKSYSMKPNFAVYSNFTTFTDKNG